MKKAIALILTLCTLLCTLTACHSRRSNYLPQDTDTAGDDTETSENLKVPVVYPANENDCFIDYVWGTNPYEGMTPAELVDLYNDWYSPSYMYPNMVNTPYYFIINPAYPGFRAFNKLTGEFCNLCKDPLCTHEKCVFSEGSSIHGIVTAPDTGTLFVLIKHFDSDAIKLYSLNYQMADAQEIYSWSNTTDAPSILFYYDHCLYYSAPYRHNNETVKKVYVLNLDTSAVSLLEGEEENKFRRMNLINGQYLYYTPDNEEACRRYDLKTGEDICVIPESILKAEEGEIGFDLNTVSRDNKMMHIQIWSSVGNHGKAQWYWYNTETGERTVSCSGLNCGDKMVFYKNHTSKDYQDDPFYMYYQNNEGLTGRANYPGGEIWVMPKAGGEEERLAYFSIDGIPLQMEIAGFSSCTTDGKCFYATYHSYKGYENEFNPDYRPLSDEEKKNVNSVEPTSGFMILDVENCKAYLFGVSFDMAWYPDRAT